MKKILSLLLCLTIWNVTAQKINAEEWDEIARKDKRVQPKFGHQRKSAAEQKTDAELIQFVLKEDSTYKKGAAHLIKTGFAFLKQNNLKKAMFRFNQAYLMDSTNANIYNGFGAVYLAVGNTAAAKKQFAAGLKEDPKNFDLLLNYGTAHLSHYYDIRKEPAKLPLKSLDTALVHFKKAYNLKPADEAANMKLAVCYWNMGKCKEAWKYYDATKALGGKLITPEFTAAMERKCKR